jgi:hypothetical protein
VLKSHHLYFEMLKVVLHLVATSKKEEEDPNKLMVMMY